MRRAAARVCGYASSAATPHGASRASWEVRSHFFPNGKRHRGVEVAAFGNMLLRVGGTGISLIFSVRRVAHSVQHHPAQVDMERTRSERDESMITVILRLNLTSARWSRQIFFFMCVVSVCLWGLQCGPVGVSELH